MNLLPNICEQIITNRVKPRVHSIGYRITNRVQNKRTQNPPSPLLRLVLLFTKKLNGLTHTQCY